MSRWGREMLMQLADLLRETLNVDCDEVWENARTPNTLTGVGVRLPSMELSVREVVTVLELLGIGRFSRRNLELDAQTVGNSERPAEGTPSRVAVDEKQIEVDGEKKWLYAAIDTKSKLLLEIDVYNRRGTDPAAAFMHRFTEKHNLNETEFLVDAGDYLTALARRELSGYLNYSDRNHVGKWFQTVSMRIDRLTPSGGAVQPAHAAGSDVSDTTITTSDRIKGSMAERQLRSAELNNALC